MQAVDVRIVICIRDNGLAVSGPVLRVRRMVQAH
jgi:hypothetical protein